MGMAGTSPHDRVPRAIPINCLHAFLLSWQRIVQNSAPPSSGYPNPQNRPQVLCTAASPSVWEGSLLLGATKSPVQQVGMLSCVPTCPVR